MASALWRTLFRRKFSQNYRLMRRYCSNTTDEEFQKTTVTILNQEADTNIMFDSFSPMGFVLNTGIRVLGPCAAFPRTVLNWNVAGAQDINKDSLSLFTLLVPKLDILVIGIGEYGAKFDTSIIHYLKTKRINVEILPTEQALPTFNFLNAEKRLVAGAFIPPLYVESRFSQDGPQPTAYQSLSQDISKMGEPISYQEHEREGGELGPMLEPSEKLQQQLQAKKDGHRFWTGTGFKLAKYNPERQREQRKLEEEPSEKPDKEER